jgi:hypothetical protein
VASLVCDGAPEKRTNALLHSQRMASIALIVIGCIDYLAYGTIFMCAMFHPKIKLRVFFSQEKPYYLPGGGVRAASV